MSVKNLGNASVQLRSQTTRLASTFHALIPPSAVPMRSFSQDEHQFQKLQTNPVMKLANIPINMKKKQEPWNLIMYVYYIDSVYTSRSDLHSHSSDMISAPQQMVAFLDVGADESYVHILHQNTLISIQDQDRIIFWQVKKFQ